MDIVSILGIGSRLRNFIFQSKNAGQPTVACIYGRDGLVRQGFAFRDRTNAIGIVRCS